MVHNRAVTNALVLHPLVWENRVRGSLLGLALGETLAFSRPHTDLLGAGPCTQLVAFTVEGMIRAALRSLHRGVCDPPSVLWSAYCRWGLLQGVLPRNGPTPDGWLADVPQLRERRGDARATVNALREAGPGSMRHPTSAGADWHALVRGLPFAALSAQVHWSDVRMAAECAALTHGHPGVWGVAAGGARLLNRLLAAGGAVPDLPGAVRSAMPGLDEHVVSGLQTAMWAAGTRPRQTDVLLSLSSGEGAPAVLVGGLYVAASYPAPEQATAALRFAADAPASAGVAAMAGAMLGALHGVGVWPVGALARYELTWVLDTLARDLVRQLTANPGGAAGQPPHDPDWNRRYPDR